MEDKDWIRTRCETALLGQQNRHRVSVITVYIRIPQCSTHFADPTNQIELIQRRAEEIRLERKEQAASAKPYGEQVRCANVFKRSAFSSSPLLLVSSTPFIFIAGGLYSVTALREND